MCLGFLNLVVLLHHLNLDRGHGHASASLQLVINAHSLQKGKGGPCKFFRHGSHEEKKKEDTSACVTRVDRRQHGSRNWRLTNFAPVREIMARELCCFCQARFLCRDFGPLPYSAWPKCQRRTLFLLVFPPLPFPSFSPRWASDVQP